MTLKSKRRVPPLGPAGGSSSDSDEGGLIDWASALATVARAVPTSPKAPQPRRKNRTSRFFFQMADELVAQSKEATKPREVEHVDQAVVKHVKTAEVSLPKNLSSNIDLVRQFFVDELSPLTLSLNTGSDQAREVIKRVIGSEVSPEAFYRFEQMAHQAVLIRLSLFLEKFLGLPEGAANDLLPKPSLRPTQSQSPAAPSDEGNTPPRRDLKTLHRTLQNFLDHQTSGDKNNGRRSREPAPVITPTRG